MRYQVIRQIQELAKTSNAFALLEDSLASITKEDLSERILDCGTIPEVFDHDSSEEKLWAKYCDILLARSLNELGIRSRVIRARGNSADILGETADYTIVGDAKAFRLSRTAKNQKDFKVSALDDWRTSNTYACLVAPLYQYPTTASQIYQQAQLKNVTLLSYIHLKLLLDYPPTTSLEKLWQVGTSLAPTKNAVAYWEAVNDSVFQLTRQSPAIFDTYKNAEFKIIQRLASEGIDYWRSVMVHYESLSQQEAIQELIHLAKIDQKLTSIQAAITKAGIHYGTMA